MKKWMLFILIISFVFACTKKKNTVGVPDNELVPHECKITYEKLERFYSYEDSLSNANSTKLSVGTFQEKTVYSLIQFQHMPDTTESVQNANLKMYIQDVKDFEATQLKIGRMNTLWAENKATWFAATDSTVWTNGETFSDNDYEEIFDISYSLESDTLDIQLPDDLVYNWITADSTNFGLVLFTENDGTEKFIEFYSTESVSYPVLSFDYFDAEEDSLISYTSSNNLATDVTIYTREEDAQVLDVQLFLANMLPARMFLKFDITASLFLQENSPGIEFVNVENSGITTEEEFSRMNILQAELVLTRKSSEINQHLLSGSVRTYLVTNESVDSDSPDLPIQFMDDYISYGKTSTLGELDFHYKIDVTAIVQTMTSGVYDELGDTFVYENKGFIIKSVNDNYDLQYLDFYTDTAENEAYRPYLKIVYTPPFGTKD
jgi:hypothetical protein